MENQHLPLTAPPEVKSCLLSYPSPWVLLVTINREKHMNSIPWAGHWEMDAVFKWFDREPNFRVAVITGTGKRSFCAGQDLIELGRMKTTNGPPSSTRHPPSGFAGLSMREGRKPVIAAVNGYALGGGFEVALNCEMVVASPAAQFGLPEVVRGIWAGAGGLPRLVRSCGLQIASEVALTGRRLSAHEALTFHLVNKVSARADSVVDEALELARAVAKNSPDAVLVTRAGLRQAWETASVNRAATLVADTYGEWLTTGENGQEGLRAFAEKREPQWKPSKL